MTRLATLLALPLLLSPVVAAQSGTIAYDRADRLDFELPPGMKDNPRFANMPNARISQVVLHFTPEAILQTRPAGEGSDGRRELAMGDGEMRAVRIAGAERGAMAAGGMAVMSFGGGAAGRRGREEILDSYTDLGTRTVTETLRFMGRTFRLSDPAPTYRWRLSTEQGMFLDHPVMKATTEHDGDQIEAWFTPDIPVPGGPEGYGGLPGMILTLNVNDGARTYTATAVTLGEPAATMQAPTDGNAVTREEYEKIVAEKLADLEKARGGRRGGETIEIIRKDG